MANNKNNIKVHLISVDNSVNNPLILNVVKTINSYLLKNKGAVSDFHLIKDIVERNCDAVDEEINHKLPVPLYLGLMGTVLGIILGLWSIDFDPNNFMNSVTDLIGSVKFAMGCSFVGLLLTTLLSAWLYRGAKAKLEEQKNELYTFIQIELLPQLSQDANSTILTMQSHLERFNNSFSENVNSFDNIMERILEAFDSQVKLNQQLEKMDVAQLANVNQNVLVQLHDSMTEFEKFNQYLGLMNSFVGQTAQLTDSVTAQLGRTEDVKQVVDSMSENIENNRLVMVKLQDFLQKVDAQSSLLQATASLDDTLSEALDQLKRHVQDQINSITQHTSQATEDLEKLMHAERGHLDKLNNLDELNKIVKSMNEMKASYDNQNTQLAGQISELSKSISNFKGHEVKTSIGIPPVVLWIVLSLMALAALLFIGTKTYSIWNEHKENIEQVDDIANGNETTSNDVAQESLDTSNADKKKSTVNNEKSTVKASQQVNETQRPSKRANK